MASCSLGWRWCCWLAAPYIFSAATTPCKPRPWTRPRNRPEIARRRGHRPEPQTPPVRRHHDRAAAGTGAGRIDRHCHDRAGPARDAAALCRCGVCSCCRAIAGGSGMPGETPRWRWVWCCAMCFGASCGCCSLRRRNAMHSHYTKALIARMDAVIATSPQAAGYLERPATVIMHGVDTDEFQPAQRQGGAALRLGLPPGMLIGCFGRIGLRRAPMCWSTRRLRFLPRHPEAKMVFTGRVTADNQGYVDDLKARLRGGRAGRARDLARRSQLGRSGQTLSGDGPVRSASPLGRLRPDADRGDGLRSAGQLRRASAPSRRRSSRVKPGGWSIPAMRARWRRPLDGMLSDRESLGPDG